MTTADSDSLQDDVLGFGEVALAKQRLAFQNVAEIAAVDTSLTPRLEIDRLGRGLLGWHELAIDDVDPRSCHERQCGWRICRQSSFCPVHSCLTILWFPRPVVSVGQKSRVVGLGLDVLGRRLQRFLEVGPGLFLSLGVVPAQPRGLTVDDVHRSGLLLRVRRCGLSRDRR